MCSSSTTDAWAVSLAKFLIANALPTFYLLTCSCATQVLGNPSSTRHWLSTTPFLFPDYGYTGRAVDGWSLCRRPRCPQCAESPEAATTHIECYVLFTRAYEPVDALDRLWRAASWRKPWRDAPVLVLPEEAAASLSSVAIVAEKHGLPELAGMPPEIQRMVRDYSTPALFWRLTAALDLAARFENGPAGDLASLPLRDVGRWERGSDPARFEDLLHRLPIIRLTIDSRVLGKLERLQDKPRFSNRRFDNMVFIVAGEECFDGIVALFKVTP